MSKTNLNFNFLHHLKHWGLALEKINHEMPHKHDDFRQSLNPNSMDAAIWLVEELKKLLESKFPPEKEYNIVILNSWLGFPLVPLLCENLKINHMDLIDIDREALELSKVFNKYYTTEAYIDINHLQLDIPFAFHDINALNTDIVISTGCEQMYPLKDLTTGNKNAVFALQSSNIIEEMYGINCVDSIEAHLENTGITKPSYTGKIQQTYHSWEGKVFFDKYMAIGTK
jgi:hypothetical protein